MIVPNPVKAIAALFRVVRALFTRKPVLVSEDVLNKRLETCYACKEGYDPVTGQCRKCTCFVEVKAQLDTETCPLKKW